jgi:NNP family nitrate/nitrite transporter-like MFS transporter
VSAALLLVPTILGAIVMHPGTFLNVAAVAGVGGGNFASSMTNINAFFPESRKGWALGLNAGGASTRAAATSVCR